MCHILCRVLSQEHFIEDNVTHSTAVNKAGKCVILMTSPLWFGIAIQFFYCIVHPSFHFVSSFSSLYWAGAISQLTLGKRRVIPWTVANQSQGMSSIDKHPFLSLTHSWTICTLNNPNMHVLEYTKKSKLPEEKQHKHRGNKNYCIVG